MATKSSSGLLSKIGLSEHDRKLLKKAVGISTSVCALIIGGFFLYNFFLKTFLSDGEISFDPGVVTDFDVEAHTFAANSFLASGRPDAALPHLQRIVSVRRDAPDALDGMVKAYLELGRFEEALASVDRLIETADGEPPPETRIRRAIALYHLGRREESEGAVRAVLSQNPRSPHALCFMGQIEAYNNPGSKTAEDYFRRAMESDSNYMEAVYQLARFHERSGDYKDAHGLLLQILAAEPLNVRAHARLGMIHYYERNADAALRAYQTALALNPHDYNTRYNLGELYYTMFNDEENALRQFVLALEGNPTHREANYKAGLICAGNDMIKEAIRYFEAALQDDRQNIRRLLQLAAAYERLGNKNKAISIYEDILNMDPLHNIARQKIRLLEIE